MRVHPPGTKEAKIEITERQCSVLRSDWSRAKLVIFILEMDQSENRIRHLTQKSLKKQRYPILIETNPQIMEVKN